MKASKLLTLGLLGGSSSFNPLSIPGLALWLDASDSSTLFQDSAGTTPAGVGDVVGYQKDKAGALNMTQSTTANKPSRITTGLSFDGTNDHLAVTFSSVALTAQTVCAVFKTGPYLNYERILGQSVVGVADYTIPNSYIPILHTNVTKWGSQFNGVFRSEVTISANTTVLFTSRHNGARLINRLNGVDASPFSCVLNYTVSEFALGRAGGDLSAYHPGTISELLMFTREINGTELAAVEAYLNAKWGVY